ncbi:DNA polymerase III PolC-type-like isoform X3 [Notolabrus celidotus]|uniref:DNA polymerase III PolC-type-like isoform X3 n=1 Tax=Notolabrus celidotus TaxID=1203425 RepID=UPI00148F5511|nr:DNA polymerase III PolC-type-like isoform X3 [Notolabrus celidotus]
MSDFKTIVFFDLETTGLDTDECDIIQLSAVCGEKVFNVYTLPNSEISEGSQKVTGLTVEDGTMFLKGEPVETIPLLKVLTSFMDFLRPFPSPVILAAHNGRDLDVPILTRVVKQLSLQQDILQVVSGFMDTLPLSRDLHPNLPSYSQGNLVQHFLDETYDAHNAVEDAQMLQKLFNKWGPDKQTVQRFIDNAACLF